MKIKNLVENIRKEMPEGLNELETLRYIYIYLGKRKNFDTAYYFGNNKTKDKMYILSRQKMNDEEFLTEKRNLICTTIASTLKLVGREFNIDIDCCADETGIGAHIYNIASLKNYGIIILDLQQDLKYIQTGRKTKNFAISDYFHVGIDQNVIEKIDEKIGYKEKNYKDADIILLSEQVKSINKLKVVDYILYNKEFLEGLKETEGYLEAANYTRETLYECIGESNVHIIPCYRDEDINKQPLPERQYSICVFSRIGNQETIYMLKKRERRYEKVEPERMRRLIAQGLKIKSDYTIAKSLMRTLYGNDNEYDLNQ